MGNDIINNMSSAFKKNQTEVQKAWDLAKEQAKAKYNDTQEEYFPYVVSLTKNILGQNTQEIQNDMNAPVEKQSIFTDPGEVSSYAPRQAEAIKDLEYFNWKEKSNNIFASVQFLIQEALYQMEFSFVKENGPKWNSKLAILSKQGISQVLIISIDHLNGDPTIQRVSTSENPILNKPQLYKVMNMAIEKYFEKYNRMSQIQYVIFTAENPSRLKFFLDYAEVFVKKFTKFQKVVEVANALRQSAVFYVALKNTTAKIREEGDSCPAGTVSSGSFGDAIPSDAGRTKKDWKKDWEVQEENSIKKYKIKRFVDPSIVD